MGASVAVKGTAAVGGSGSHNYIANSAAAKIENANIDSAGNVGVVAQSDEAITNYAGVIDVAAYGQGVSAALGVTGSNNKISGNTEALIRNSKVVAESKKDEAGNYIFEAIQTRSKLKTDDAYLIDGAVTSNTWSAGKLQTGREEEEKTGVVVDASATHAIASVLANGGVAVGSGGGGRFRDPCHCVRIGQRRRGRGIGRQRGRRFPGRRHQSERRGRLYDGESRGFAAERRGGG